MTIKEHDCVVLTADLPKEGLKAGDVGTVVHVHGDGAAYEVEFMTFAGKTIAVATVEASDVRPVGERDVSHVRELQSARASERVTRHRWEGPLSLAVVIVTLTVLLAPLWRGQVTPWADGSDYFASYFSLVADHARQGRLVGWSPWTNGGTPTFVEPQVGALSPLTLLSALVLGPTERGFRLYWCALWLLAALGMWRLARHLGAPPAPAAAIALGYSLSGLFCGNAEHTPFVYAGALLPWVLWRWDVMLQEGSIPAGLQACALGGLCALGGYPGLVVATVGFCGLWALGRMLSGSVAPRPAPWLTAAVTALLVAAPLYVSFAYEAKGFSDRAGPLARNLTITENALTPGALWTLISPALAPLKFTHHQLWPATDVSSVSLYTGLVPLVLALLAALSVDRWRWRVALGWIALLSVVTACSVAFPLRGWLYDLLPPFRYFRHSSLFRIFAMVALCALAADTALALAERPSLRRRFAIGACVAAVLLALAYRYVMTRVVGAPIDHTAIALCVTVPIMLSAALAAPPSPVGRSIAVGALLAAALVDGVFAFHSSAPVIYDASPAARAKWNALNEAHTSELRLQSLRRVVGSGINNDNLLTKVPELHNYSPLKNGLHTALRASPQAEAMVTADRRVWFGPTAPRAPATKATLDVLQQQFAAGHAPTFVVHSRAAMLGSGDDPALNPATLPIAQPADVRLIDYRPSQLIFEWQAPTDGWLFVGDRWARSWTARVNGTEIDVDGANLVFRAIRVPAGPLHVEMTYRPRLWLLMFPSWSLLLVALASAVWRFPKASRRGKQRGDLITEGRRPHLLKSFFRRLCRSNCI